MQLFLDFSVIFLNFPNALSFHCTGPKGHYPEVGGPLTSIQQ